MNSFLKYGIALASGFVGAFLGRKFGPDVGAYAEGTIASGMALAAARLLHLQAPPQK